MKAFWLPCSVLCLILVLSLLNGSAIGHYTDLWMAQIQQAEDAAAAGDWSAAEQTIQAVYDQWREKQTYLHIVEIHNELNEAETALLCALACAQSQDETEFLCETQELISQFRILAEMEQLNIKNIL